jgi:hypothetical protein
MYKHLIRSEVEFFSALHSLSKLIPCNITASIVETQGLSEKQSCDSSYASHRAINFIGTVRGISSIGYRRNSAQERRHLKGIEALAISKFICNSCTVDIGL